MRHGEWLLVRTDQLSVVEYYPYTKHINTSGKMGAKFQPHLNLDTPSGPLLVHGMRAIWSILDALFHQAPLPRRVVSEDLRSHDTGFDAISGLLSDPDAWPYLRLNVRDGEHFHPFGGTLSGTWVLAASPAASPVEITSDLQGLQAAFEGAYTMPLTLWLKDRHATIPAVFCPHPEDHRYVVVATDPLNGKHIVFSVFNQDGSSFRPRKHRAIEAGKSEDLLSEVQERCDEMRLVHAAGLEPKPMRHLPESMRFTEVDDLEYRRFLSIHGVSDLLGRIGFIPTDA